MVQFHENVGGVAGAFFKHTAIWKAPGHVDPFNDPLIDNKDSKKRYRIDVRIEDYLQKLEEKIEKEVNEQAGSFFAGFFSPLAHIVSSCLHEYEHKHHKQIIKIINK